MMDGSKKISCVGIVGDGCGGGREFIIENEKLIAYDPQTKKKILLLDEVKGALSIRKQSCLLFVECKDEIFKYDLSLMSKI